MFHHDTWSSFQLNYLAPGSALAIPPSLQIVMHNGGSHMPAQTVASVWNILLLVSWIVALKIQREVYPLWVHFLVLVPLYSLAGPGSPVTSLQNMLFGFHFSMCLLTHYCNYCFVFPTRTMSSWMAGYVFVLFTTVTWQMLSEWMNGSFPQEAERALMGLSGLWPKLHVFLNIKGCIDSSKEIWDVLRYSKNRTLCQLQTHFKRVDKSQLHLAESLKHIDRDYMAPCPFRSSHKGSWWIL